MSNDSLFRTCLVSLGAFMLLIWVVTFSFKKMIVTYFFGILGIAGIFLPDWEFFDRDFKEWFTPMPVHYVPRNDRVPRIGSFKLYPLRVAMLITVYSYGLYKWWSIMSR